jgi:hypothetical protein
MHFITVLCRKITPLFYSFVGVVEKNNQACQHAQVLDFADCHNSHRLSCARSAEMTKGGAHRKQRKSKTGKVKSRYSSLY